MRITVTENGPYVVKGGVPLDEAAIVPVAGHREYRTGRTFSDQETYALCRCGRTNTPPFCDGSHLEGFDGTETAGHEPYRDRADVYPGDGVYLFDDNRCAYARFCHREDGDVWSLTEASYDPHYKREAVRASSDCPAGRLTHVDTETSQVYEPSLAPGITLLEDTEEGVSGPLFVHWAHHVGSRRRHRIRTAQPLRALPLRRVAQQTLLRRPARERGVLRRFRPAALTRGRLGGRGKASRRPRPKPCAGTWR